MKQCWPEGDWRAYFDGELPPQSQERMTAHLAACQECGARYRELSARAERVSNLMAMLPAVQAGEVPSLPIAARHGRQWTVAALSLAAALAIGFVMFPKKHAPTVPHTPPAPPPTVAPPVVASIPPAVPHRAIRRAAARPMVQYTDFVRLDDEPLETGTIVRVSAENGDVQADLLMGPDGRAHAIRLIGKSSKESQ
jgi:anti-sigma factor RsiW